jgi:hypothetical protein
VGVAKATQYNHREATAHAPVLDSTRHVAHNPETEPPRLNNKSIRPDQRRGARGFSSTYPQSALRYTASYVHWKNRRAV